MDQQQAGVRYNPGAVEQQTVAGGQVTELARASTELHHVLDMLSATRDTLSSFVNSRLGPPPPVEAAQNKELVASFNDGTTGDVRRGIYAVNSVANELDALVSRALDI